MPGTPDERRRPADVVAAASAEYVDLLGPARVLSGRVDPRLYGYDASLEFHAPDLVVLPRGAADLEPVLAVARRHDLPFVVRGAGTGYSGGALATEGGVVIAARDLDQILEIDPDALTVRCEPGVVLEDLQTRVAAYGLRYLPDPSSHRVCTIGGNVAENAGGPHALGHGPTSNFVVALRVLLPDGQVVELHEDDVLRGGLDLRALMVGSEGTLGVIMEVTLRLVPQPESQRIVVASFRHQDDAVRMVESVLSAGLTPTALDMLTGAYVPGHGETDDRSVLFIDVEGRSRDVEAQVDRVVALAEGLGGHTDVLQMTEFLHHRAELVKDKVRRMVARTGLPRYYLFDCVVPRSRLRELMASLRTAADRHGLPLLNTFHAGDGNVHPTPFYDPDEPGHQDRLRTFSAEVLSRCAELGGSLSGEHGIGTEKRELMPLFHGENEMAAMRAVKAVLDPHRTCNPGKLVPASSASPQAGNRRPQDAETESDKRAVVVDQANGTLIVTDADVTFADCIARLQGTPFELAYEPVGWAATRPVLAALDLGLPGVREPHLQRVRDLVLSCTFSGDGHRRTFGGRCAKDVSGYELRKLAFGARGRLGRLTAATLRLTAAPSHRHALRGACAGAEQAVGLAEHLRVSGLPLSLLAVIVREGATSVVAGLESFGADLTHERTTLHALMMDTCSASLAETGTAHDWWGWLPPGTTSYRRSSTLVETADLLRGGHDACWLPGQRAVWSAAPGTPLEPDLVERGNSLAEAVRNAW